MVGTQTCSRASVHGSWIYMNNRRKVLLFLHTVMLYCFHSCACSKVITLSTMKFMHVSGDGYCSWQYPSSHTCIRAYLSGRACCAPSIGSNTLCTRCWQPRAVDQVLAVTCFAPGTGSDMTCTRHWHHMLCS